MSTKRVMNAIISRYGESVTVQPRRVTTTDDDARPVYDYPEYQWFRTRAMLYDASGLREQWYEIGRQDEVEFVASFYSNLRGKIEPGDRVILVDGTLLLVDFVIDRGRGSSRDFLEVLLKRGN